MTALDPTSTETPPCWRTHCADCQRSRKPTWQQPIDTVQHECRPSLLSVCSRPRSTPWARQAGFSNILKQTPDVPFPLKNFSRVCVDNRSITNILPRRPSLKLASQLLSVFFVDDETAQILCSYPNITLSLNARVSQRVRTAVISFVHQAFQQMFVTCVRQTTNCSYHGPSQEMTFVLFLRPSSDDFELDHTTCHGDFDPNLRAFFLCVSVHKTSSTWTTLTLGVSLRKTPENVDDGLNPASFSVLSTSEYHTAGASGAKYMALLSRPIHGPSCASFAFFYQFDADVSVSGPVEERRLLHLDEHDCVRGFAPSLCSCAPHWSMRDLWRPLAVWLQTNHRVGPLSPTKRLRTSGLAEVPSLWWTRRTPTTVPAGSLWAPSRLTYW